MAEGSKDATIHVDGMDEIQDFLDQIDAAVKEVRDAVSSLRLILNSGPHLRIRVEFAKEAR